MNNARGFTLIEVLIALAVLAIALTAMIKANVSSVSGTQQLQHKHMAHLVAMQAVARLQLGLNKNKSISLFGTRWYWRVEIKPSGLDQVERLSVTTSTHSNGPFGDPFIAFKVAHDDKK